MDNAYSLISPKLLARCPTNAYFTNKSSTEFKEAPCHGSRNSLAEDHHRPSRRSEIITERNYFHSSPGDSFGSLTILAFINDLLEVVKTSDARQFVDDSLLYRHISNEKDSLDFKPISLHPEKMHIDHSLHQQAPQEEHFVQITRTCTGPSGL